LHDLFTIATVSEESHRAYLLNSQLFTILRHEDKEEAINSEQVTPSVDTAGSYPSPLSIILAVVRAGRSTVAFMIRTTILITTNSLPGSFHFGRGRVYWHRGLPEAPTLARKPFLTSRLTVVE
jgi:hypothetical protein